MRYFIVGKPSNEGLLSEQNNRKRKESLANCVLLPLFYSAVGLSLKILCDPLTKILPLVSPTQSLLFFCTLQLTTPGLFGAGSLQSVTCPPSTSYSGSHHKERLMKRQSVSSKAFLSLLLQMPGMRLTTDECRFVLHLAN
jgi:hypothetical protein